MSEPRPKVAKPPQPQSGHDFDIALICALKIESDAVEALLDGCWSDEDVHIQRANRDPNIYTIGWMSGHNVVLVYMPNMGKIAAASTSIYLKGSFPGIKLALIVGVCGGVPNGSGDDEVLLGDIIISTGVEEFDFGSRYEDGFKMKNTLNERIGRQNHEIRAFIHKMRGKAASKRLTDCLYSFLDQLCLKQGFKESAYPGIFQDKLFHSGYRHKHRNPIKCDTCRKCTDWRHPVCGSALKSSCIELGCAENELITDGPRKAKIRRMVQKSSQSSYNGTILQKHIMSMMTRPRTHFGAIGSSDGVLKSGRDRDYLALKLNVIAFEMEGAGVWDNIPTIVVKSVCDYADSHKNKDWQQYAAATAAACLKALLIEWQISERLVPTLGKVVEDVLKVVQQGM